MKRVFLQFYYLPPHSLLTPYYAVQNGFSSVLEDCKQAGEVMWIEYNIASTIQETLKLQGEFKLPAKADEVFVSCWLYTQLYLVYLWALKYPEITFIVGGPTVRAAPPILLFNLPENMVFNKGLAEEIFNRKPNPTTWRIEPLPKKDLLPMYTFYISGTCYWEQSGKRCSFCNYSSEDKREFDLDTLRKYAIPGTVYLWSPSFSPSDIKSILPKLPYTDTYNYFLFIRGGIGEMKAVQETLPRVTKPENLTWYLGVEFPSKRILDNMSKGVTLDSLIETINTISSFGCKIILSHISRWPDLKERDLEDASYFVDRVNIENVLHRFKPLFIKTSSNLEKEIKGTSISYGPFFIGYVPTLTSEQEELNKKVIRIFKDKERVVSDCSYIKDLYAY